jgi:hypothetical protein
MDGKRREAAGAPKRAKEPGKERTTIKSYCAVDSMRVPVPVRRAYAETCSHSGNNTSRSLPSNNSRVNGFDTIVAAGSIDLGSMKPV